MTNSLQTRAAELLAIVGKATHAEADWSVRPVIDCSGKPYATNYITWVFVGDHVGLWADEGSDLSDARAIATLPDLAQCLREAMAEIERIDNNRDMWKGQCERQAARLETLHAALSAIVGHQTLVGGSMAQYSATLQIARKALGASAQDKS